MLPLKNIEGYELQEGTANINIWVERFDNGMPDEATLKAIVQAVITALKAESVASEYFELDIKSGEPD